MRFDDLHGGDFFRANSSGDMVRERMRPREAGQGHDEMWRDEMREGPG